MWELGRFKPELPTRGARCAIVEDEFDLWLQERITDPYSVHVRSPDHGYSLASEPTDRQDDWHIDGARPMNLYVAFWSNGLGTEIRDPRTGREFQNRPYQVILIDNMTYMHRSPRWTRFSQIEDRWFARAFFLRKAKIHDVPGVYRLTP